MPINLFLPIALRLAGPLAFGSAAIIAGVMNRSIMIVPILALAGAAAAILIRIYAPSPVLEVKNLLNPDAPPKQPGVFDGLGRRLIFGVLGYGILFFLAAWIAALFQSTEFAQQVQGWDLGFAAVPAIIALIGAWLSARIGYNQMASMTAQMQDMFAQMNDPAGPTADDEDSFTFEGEIIDPDAKDS